MDNTPRVPYTNEELTTKLAEAIQLMEGLRQRVSTLEEDNVALVNYVQELDSVTFVALYLMTGKLKKTDIGTISSSRITQANALRINGRRALGEYREKEAVKELKEQATELGIEFDKDTKIEDIEKAVASELAAQTAKKEQEKREEKDAVSN